MSGPLGSSQWMYASGYEVGQSLRLNDNADLTRTPGASNRRTYTLSAWIKRTGLMSASNCQVSLLDVYVDTNNFTRIVIESDDQLQLLSRVGNQNKHFLKTSGKFRDPNAWYHIVVAIDTTDGTANDRGKIYINGVESTFESRTNPDQNYEGHINAAVLHDIGKSTDTTLDGYLAEYNFIDGLALDASYFGETDGTYGHWKPKEYSGSYGTNGFYLPFEQDYTVEGFNTVVYKGTAVNHYIGGVGFTPDFVWTKCRSATKQHILVDAVRGGDKNLMSDSTEAENSSANRKLTLGAADGYVIDSNSGHLNESDKTYVSWNWDMGGSNANNTTGDIDSVVRANATYGQSIVSYTGNGTAGATVGHGLSSTPEMIILKNRESSVGWVVYHKDNTDAPETDALSLNVTDVSSDYSWWNDTAPTSSVFSLGGITNTNANNIDFIAYCFHSVTGYSSFGKYTGNGNASGTSVTTGFEPAFVLVKGLSGTMTHKHWTIRDNTRTPNNDRTKGLHANKTEAEFDAANNAMNFSSTGFQLKGTDPGINENNIEYIYMAFANKREYAYFLDQSGNNNDWSTSHLTESDVMVDSPTNNFATGNPLIHRHTYGWADLTEGNLQHTNAGLSSSWGGLLPTMLPTTGKYYAEVYCQGDSDGVIGVFNFGTYGLDHFLVQNPYLVAGAWAIYTDNSQGVRYDNGNNASNDNNVTDFMQNKVMGIAIDNDNSKLFIYKNNVVVATINNLDISDTAATDAFAFTSLTADSTARTFTWNFGQDSSFAGKKTAQGNQDSGGVGDFFYEPPSGFLALCTKNLPAVAANPSENFNTVLYTGNGSTNAITVGFQPDFVWGKDRSGTDHNHLFDAIRGTNQRLISNANSAENTESNCLDSFDTNGFTLGSNTGLNNNNDLHVAWSWNMGGTTASNSDGSITSSIRANPSAGQSIVTYTGTGSNATVGHGLSSVPGFIAVKTRNNTGDWMVFYGDNTDFLKLNEYNDTEDLAAVWNDTSPTSSVFTIGTNTDVNVDGRTYVAYCFSSIDGYSSAGTYKGNAGSNETDGTFVYTGFRPAWVMCKLTSTDGESWLIKDNKRSPFNPADEWLYADKNAAEATANTTLRDIDFLSNGFKFRGWSTELNGNGESYTYLAFAETPFKYSNAR